METKTALIPAAAGADLIVMINPIVPIYNDRAVVCIPTIDGQCAIPRRISS